eukprot:m.498235 g.498235  ORF g.498235 m.498235 type:complete len:1100 (-) comp53549_c0_seq1:28-3327(-)
MATRSFHGRPNNNANFSHNVSSSFARSVTCSSQGSVKKGKVSSSFKRKAPTLGRIQLRMKFVPREELLTVTVLRGEHFPAASLPDMYVRAQLLSDKTWKRKTRAVPAGTQNEWQDTLPPFKMTPETLKDDLLRLQVVCGDARTATTLGESFVTLADCGPLETTTWHWLQPELQDQEDKRRTLNAGSLWRRSKRDKSEESETDTAAFVAWLNEWSWTQDTVPSTMQRKTLLAYKEDASSAFLMEKFGIFQAEADVLWELFTSELVHLNTLSVLCETFRKCIQAIQTHQSQLGRDARFPDCMMDIDVDRLFANAHELFEVSLQFARSIYAVFQADVDPMCNKLNLMDDSESQLSFNLEEILAPSTHTPRSTSPCSTRDARLTTTMVAALKELQACILPPELAYRSRYKQCRAYLQQLLDTKGMQFAAFVKWGEEDERCSRMSLLDLLMQPLQRLTRYPLLIKAWAKALPPGAGKDQVEDCGNELEAAITKQNLRVKASEASELLSFLDCSLVWPSVAEMNPNAYIPDQHQELLTSAPHTSLRQDQHAFSSKRMERSIVMHSKLELILRNGKTESLEGYLFEDMLVLAVVSVTPSKASNKLNTGASELRSGSSVSRRASVSMSRTSFVLNRNSAGNSTTAPPEEHLRLFERPFHMAEVEVLDITSEASPANCFLVLVSDGFLNVTNCFTLQAASVFQKADWIKYLTEQTEAYSHPFKRGSLAGRRCTSERNLSEMRRSSRSLIDLGIQQKLEESCGVLHRTDSGHRLPASTSSSAPASPHGVTASPLCHQDSTEVVVHQQDGDEEASRTSDSEIVQARKQTWSSRSSMPDIDAAKWCDRTGVLTRTGTSSSLSSTVQRIRNLVSQGSMSALPAGSFSEASEPAATRRQSIHAPKVLIHRTATEEAIAAPGPPPFLRLTTLDEDMEDDAQAAKLSVAEAAADASGAHNTEDDGISGSSDKPVDASTEASSSPSSSALSAVVQHDGAVKVSRDSDAGEGNPRPRSRSVGGGWRRQLERSAGRAGSLSRGSISRGSISKDTAAPPAPGRPSRSNTLINLKRPESLRVSATPAMRGRAGSRASNLRTDRSRGGSSESITAVDATTV